MPELNVFLMAMSPLAELRGAIPLALGVYHLPIVSAFLISVIGNIFPIIFILLFLEPISKFLSSRFSFFNKFFNWLFERTRRRNSAFFAKWQNWALMFFVAIPLPFTGAWTGALCAFVFGIPFKKALPIIFLGIIVAGVLVSLATLGIIKIV